MACFEEPSLNPRLLNLIATLGQMHLVVQGLDAKKVEASFPGDHLILDL